MYKIISYLNNKIGTQKDSIIYDVHNKRVIEKWISYQLVKDKSEFIITDRQVFTYNNYGLINKKIIIKKGDDNSHYSLKFNDDNEYSYQISRKVKKINTISEILYRKTFYDSKLSPFFQKLIKIETIEDEISGDYKIRILSKFQNRKLYKFKYQKDNPFYIKSIDEHAIILDLSFLNNILKHIINIPNLNLFIIGKLKNTIPVSNNEMIKINYDKQNYFRNFTLDCSEKVNIYTHEILLEEDLFMKEMVDLKTIIDTETNKTVSNIENNNQKY